MFWKILQIEPTADKARIKDAYRKLLSVTNPEDKPEEFKQLREAYEEAMAYADANGGKKKTPLEVWSEELSELYGNFKDRLDVGKWQSLLNEKVVVSIDSRMKCEELLLNFLMDHYFLSHEVWVYLDSQFSFKERVNELYDSYPRDFIDYAVLNGIRFEDNLPMKMFVPGLDGDECQKYVSIYYRMLNSSDPREALNAGEELMSLSEKHPYGDARYQQMLLESGHEEALKELFCLKEEYPEDLFIGNLLISQLLKRGDYEDCFTLIDEFKKICDHHFDLRYNEACALAGIGRKKEAVKALNRLLRESSGNVQMQYELDEKRREWNKDIMTELEEKLESGEASASDIADLTWTYLENDMPEKAKEMFSRLPENYEDRFDYYNLHSSLAIMEEDYGRALENLNHLAEVIKTLPDDSEENHIRRNRLGETMNRIGYCCYRMKDMEGARAAYDMALQYPESRIEALQHLAQIYFNTRDYDKTIEYADRMMEEYPEAYQAYMLKALACFRQYRDREAYNAVEHALDLCRSDVSLYALKARILMRNGAADGAKEILDFLVENGLAEDPLVLFCLGVQGEDVEKDYDKATKYYEQSLKELDGHEKYVEYGAELLYRLLCLKGEKLDGGKEDRKIMMDLAEKGLVCNPDHYGLLDYKAWLLKRGKDYEEALKVYQKLLTYPDHSPSIEAMIGNIFYQDLENKADQSLEYYLKSLERGGDPSGHFYAGMCHLHMMQFEEAEKHFLLLKEAEPDSTDGSYRLSFLYAMKGDLKKALAEADETIRLCQDSKGNQSRFYVRKANILRRMKRFEEAVATIEEAMERYDYVEGYRMIFQIYAQSAQFDKAKKHLEKWKKALPDSPELSDCQILLHMYTGDFKSAKKKKEQAKNLNPDRDLELDQIISGYFGDYELQRRQIEKWRDYRIDQGSFDLSRILGTLAQCCFSLGDLESARNNALEALKEVDEALSGFGTNRLLFLARKIRLLAILGKKEETLKLIEECKRTPFCENCPEHHCKDVDFFAMEAYEIFGEDLKALEIAKECRELYPDEEDFIIAMHHYGKKGIC